MLLLLVILRRRSKRSYVTFFSLVEGVEESNDFVLFLLSRECKSQLSAVPFPRKGYYCFLTKYGYYLKTDNMFFRAGKESVNCTRAPRNV